MEPVPGDVDARRGPPPRRVSGAGYCRGEHAWEYSSGELPAAEFEEVGEHGAEAGRIGKEVCAWVLGACAAEGVVNWLPDGA